MMVMRQVIPLWIGIRPVSLNSVLLFYGSVPLENGRIYTYLIHYLVQHFISLGGGAEVFTDSLLVDFYLRPSSIWVSEIEKNLGQPAVHWPDWVKLKSVELGLETYSEPLPSL
jgi:hypothetical protein